jgi:hypothetical protein
MLHIELLPGAISELVVATSESKVLTLADRYGLMAAILNEFISEEEIQSLNRLLRYIVNGRVQVVDQLSADQYLGFWITGLN